MIFDKTKFGGKWTSFNSIQEGLARGGIGRMGGRRKREEIWGYMYTYS